MRDPRLRRHVWCWLYDRRLEMLRIGDSLAVQALRTAREEWEVGSGFSALTVELVEQAKADYSLNPETYNVKGRNEYGLAVER